jgi:hypothetical protein
MKYLFEVNEVDVFSEEWPKPIYDPAQYKTENRVTEPSLVKFEGEIVLRFKAYTPCIEIDHAVNEFFLVVSRKKKLETV